MLSEPVSEAFHPGEQALQRRAGTRERLQALGPRLLRDHLIEQHRQFFALLPFVVAGAADPSGQPWATAITGERTGFIAAPDEHHLRIGALPAPDDPLAPLLRAGAPIALLGIELPTRRRNRANGHVAAVDAGGFSVRVRQSFGNCPKYIQRRAPAGHADAPAAAPLRSARLGARAAALVRTADTFFIATHAAADAASGGSDVSHRGGRPGFVQVGDDGATLSWPDFAGNGFFNTFGNLALQPRAGLLFADFERGDLLHVAGRAELLWDGPALASFAGAERLVRLHVDAVLLRPAAWPLRWRLVEASPFLAGTGTW